MKIVVKIISGLLITLILLIVGYFGYRFIKNDFDFNKTFGIGVSDKLIEEKELEVFNNILVDFNTSNVEIKHSIDNNYKVLIYSDHLDSHNIEVNEEGVKVSLKEKKLRFLDRLFNHKQSLIVIYIPSDYEGNITVNGDVGNIKTDDYQYALIETKINVGDIYVDGIKEGNSDLDVGSIKVKKLYSNCEVKLNAGDVKMKEVTILKDSIITVDAGNISIDEVNDVKIDAEVDLGDKDIEKSNEEALNTLNVVVRAGNITVHSEKVTEEGTND
jgi:predicted nucleotidyltransferase